LLQDLNEVGEGACFGFVGEEMDVLGHQDVGGYGESLLFTGLFEDLLDGVFCFCCVEEGLAFVTTECDEVKLVGLVEASEARWHGGSSSLHPTLRKSAKDGAPGLLWLVGCGRAWWFERFTSHRWQSREGWGTRPSPSRGFRTVWIASDVTDCALVVSNMQSDPVCKVIQEDQNVRLSGR
jgi:hypothetical protein